MIDLTHKYALLEDGTIEPLYYSDGEMRMAYRDRDELYYLDHDVWGEIFGHRAIFYHHSRILATSDIRENLEGLHHGQTT